MSMADYLPSKSADYAGILSVAPQNTMVEKSVKNQTLHEGDDGTIVVTTLSAQSYFTVTMEWGMIPTADAEIIFDFWNDPAKANGMAKTFYWEHPTDGETYIVRFMTDISKVYTAGLITDRGINSITIRVSGVR